MSKRPGSATEAKPPKWARKPTGFRVARAASTLQSTGPSTSSNSTLHVTVNPTERRGTTRVFSNTPEQPARSATPATLPTHSNFPEHAGDTRHNHDDTLPVDPLAESLPVADSEVPQPPKRTRNTKNAVSYHSGF
jgi:hypothetical protein